MNNDFGKDRMFPLVLRLVIPSMLAQLVNVLYGIVDRIFVSRLPYGDLALAGVGVCAPVVSLLTSVAFLLGLGGAPLMAMKMGEKSDGKAEKILFNCFFALAVTGAALSAVMFFIKDDMLMAFGASRDSFAYADRYMTVYLIGGVFAIVSLGLNSFITAQGCPKTAMGTVLIGAVGNIVLDPLFIFTFDMGVTGAAVATVIAQFLSCLWAVLFLVFSRRISVRLRPRALSARLIGRVMKLGLSPFVITATDSVIFIMLNSVLQRLGGAGTGDIYVTAATVTVSYIQLITMPMSGLTMACQPIVSYNYGARNTARVRKAVASALIVCLVFTSVMTLVSQFLPSAFVRIFTSDPVIMPIAVWGMRVNTAGIIVLSMQYVFVDLLIAMSAAGRALALSLFRKLFMIALIVLLPLGLGWRGAFYAEPIADVASGILATAVYLLTVPALLRRRETADDIRI